MAQAETLLSPHDRRIIAAAAAYFAGNAAIERLCGQYDDVPPELAEPCYRQMQAAKRRALRCSAATMAGVIAKARMIEAGELLDVDPLIESAIRDLLAVQERSSPTWQASSSCPALKLVPWSA